MLLIATAPLTVAAPTTFNVVLTLAEPVIVVLPDAVTPDTFKAAALTVPPNVP